MKFDKKSSITGSSIAFRNQFLALQKYTKDIPMKLKLLNTIAVLLLAAPAIAQQVSVNFLPSVSFAQHHTYAWATNDANQIQNSILAQLAKQDIDTAMRSKGLTVVTEDKNPDIIIPANGGMKHETSYQAWGMRGIGGGMGTITPQQNIEAR